MTKVTWQERIANDARIIRTPNEARRLCSGTSYDWPAVRSRVLVPNNPSHGVIHKTLLWPDGIGDVDHALLSHRPEDVVGKTV